MPDAIDLKTDVGVLAERAWHSGWTSEVYRILDRPITIHDLESDPRLWFQYEKMPMMTTHPFTGEQFTVPDQYLNVCNDPTTRLAYPVGSKYTVHQWMETVLPLLEVLQAMGCTIESAGTFGSRSKCFVSIRLPDGVTYPGYSASERVINIGDSFDGSVSKIMALAIWIIVCANTFKANLLGVPAHWKLRHTASIGNKWDDAKRGVEEAMASATQFDLVAHRMMNESYVTSEFERLMVDVIGERPEMETATKPGRSRTMYDNKAAGIRGRWHGQDLAAVKETKWAALMSFQAYEQHVQGGDDLKRAGRHMTRTIFTEQPLASKAASLLVV